MWCRFIDSVAFEHIRRLSIPYREQPGAASTGSRLSYALIHKRVVGCMMWTGKFKPLVYHNFARVTAVFLFGFKLAMPYWWQKDVYYCLVTIYKVLYRKYNPLSDQSDYRITPSYTLRRCLHDNILKQKWRFCSLFWPSAYTKRRKHTNKTDLWFWRPKWIPLKWSLKNTCISCVNGKKKMILVGKTNIMWFFSAKWWSHVSCSHDSHVLIIGAHLCCFWMHAESCRRSKTIHWEKFDKRFYCHVNAA